MIIVEGMDNTGKTTLVRELERQFPELQYRPSIGNKHDLQQIKQQAYEEAFEPMPLVLADRSRIISEFIYNPVLKARPTAYSYTHYLDFVKGLLNGHHLVIFAWRPIHDLLKTFDSRDQLGGVKEHVRELHQAYLECEGMLRFLARAGDSRTTFHDYDYGDGVSHTLALTKVGQYIEEVR